MGIKKDVAQELFDKLHPEFDKLKPGEQMRLMEEEDVISDNLEEILEYCSKYKKNNPKNGDVAILRSVVNHYWAETLFKTLYPNFEKMSPGKRFEAESDAIYIEGHLEEIVELKQEYGERNRNLDKKEVLRAVINYNRAHSMFDEMYPDYDKLPIGKQFELEGVQAHIVDNVENILKLKRQNERNYPNMTPVDATRYAVEESMSSAKPKKR